MKSSVYASSRATAWFSSVLALVFSQVWSGVFAGEVIELGPSCTTSECHVRMGKSEFQHGPMKQGKCDPCHVPIGNRHEFAKIETRPKFCLRCHAVASSKSVQHKPFVEDCLLCHDVHESNRRYLVEGGTGKEGCLRAGCHDAPSGNHAFGHAPFDKGGCLVCHTPHQSDHGKLLTHQSGDLCLLCHEATPGVSTDIASVHMPEIQKKCVSCHSPHGGQTPSLVPADEADFCGGCHESVFSQQQFLRFPHGALTDKKKCRNCHAPHASRQNHLLTAPVSDLCLDCHDKPVDTGKRILPNIALELNQAKQLHGPLVDRNCVVCHRAHGSNLENILRMPFPSGFYAAYDSSLYEGCFGCHDRESFEKRRSTRTRFRNGNQNLHSLHVVQEKGHTCSVCHRAHGGNQPRMLRENIAFGKWKIPLEFSLAQAGGLCRTACHPVRRYDQTFPIDNTQETEFVATNAPGPSSLRPGDKAPFVPLFELSGEVYDPMAATQPTILLFLNPTDLYSTQFLKEIRQVLARFPTLAGDVDFRIVLASVDETFLLGSSGSSPTGRAISILYDSQDRGFSIYGVISTPTAFIVGQDQRVRFTARGYDLDMANRIARKLFEMLGQEAPAARPAALDPDASPHLLLARRLLARGLWELALEQYEEIVSKNASSPSVRAEMAEALLEMDRAEEAVALLVRLSEEHPENESLRLSLDRALRIRAEGKGAPKPPKVMR